MKSKFIVFSAAALILLSSCVKDYKCKCVSRDLNSLRDTTYFTDDFRASKSTAGDKCESLTRTSNGTSTTCESVAK